MVLSTLQISISELLAVLYKPSFRSLLGDIGSSSKSSSSSASPSLGNFTPLGNGDRRDKQCCIAISLQLNCIALARNSFLSFITIPAVNVRDPFQLIDTGALSENATDITSLQWLHQVIRKEQQILVGFASGLCQVFSRCRTKSGGYSANLIFTFRLHDCAVTRIKLSPVTIFETTVNSEKNEKNNVPQSGQDNEEIWLLHKDRTVTAFSIRTLQNEIKNFQMQQTQNALVSQLYPFSKWRLSGQDKVHDFVPVKPKRPLLFEIFPRSDAVHIVAVGSSPPIAQYTAGSGEEDKDLSDLAAEVAAQAVTVVSSAFTGWLGWSDESTTSSSSSSSKTKTSNSNFRDEEAVKLPVSLKVPENARRCIESISLGPNNSLAVLTDSLGRVLLVDAETLAILRVWKGYRHAEVGWFHDVERWKGQWDGIQCPSCDEEFNSYGKRNNVALSFGLYLAIYAPERSVLEIWRMRFGPRVRAIQIRGECSLFTSFHSGRARCILLRTIEPDSEEEDKKRNVTHCKNVGGNGEWEMSEIGLDCRARAVTLRYFSQNEDQEEGFALYRVIGTLENLPSKLPFATEIGETFISAVKESRKAVASDGTAERLILSWEEEEERIKHTKTDKDEIDKIVKLYRIKTSVLDCINSIVSLRSPALMERAADALEAHGGAVVSGLYFECITIMCTVLQNIMDEKETSGLKLSSPRKHMRPARVLFHNFKNRQKVYQSYCDLTVEEDDFSKEKEEHNWKEMIAWHGENMSQLVPSTSLQHKRKRVSFSNFRRELSEMLKRIRLARASAQEKSRTLRYKKREQQKKEERAEIISSEVDSTTNYVKSVMPNTNFIENCIKNSLTRHCRKLAKCLFHRLLADCFQVRNILDVLDKLGLSNDVVAMLFSEWILNYTLLEDLCLTPGLDSIESNGICRFLREFFVLGMETSEADEIGDGKQWSVYSGIRSSQIIRKICESSSHHSKIIILADLLSSAIPDQYKDKFKTEIEAWSMVQRHSRCVLFIKKSLSSTNTNNSVSVLDNISIAELRQDTAPISSIIAERQVVGESAAVVGSHSCSGKNVSSFDINRITEIEKLSFSENQIPKDSDKDWKSLVKLATDKNSRTSEERLFRARSCFPTILKVSVHPSLLCAHRIVVLFQRIDLDSFMIESEVEELNREKIDLLAAAVSQLHLLAKDDLSLAVAIGSFLWQKYLRVLCSNLLGMTTYNNSVSGNLKKLSGIGGKPAVVLVLTEVQKVLKVLQIAKVNCKVSPSSVTEKDSLCKEMFDTVMKTPIDTTSLANHMLLLQLWAVVASLQIPLNPLTLFSPSQHLFEKNRLFKNVQNEKQIVEEGNNLNETTERDQRLIKTLKQRRLKLILIALKKDPPVAFKLASLLSVPQNIVRHQHVVILYRNVCDVDAYAALGRMEQPTVVIPKLVKIARLRLAMLLDRCKSSPKFAPILSCVDAATSKWILKEERDKEVLPASLTLTVALLRRIIQLVEESNKKSASVKNLRLSKNMLDVALSMQEAALSNNLENNIN
eukprot:g378.t1